MPDDLSAGLDAGGHVLLSGLRSAAFPDASYPGALAYLPPAFDPSRLSVLVYLHGWDNCVQNIVRPQAGRCAPTGELCPAADLIGHLDRSSRSALLLCPELRYHAKSSDPGALGQPGALRALLGEVLERLADQVGGAGADDVGHVVVVSHSGGYRAAASLAVQGGVPVQELYLLDSLYGEQDLFDRFVSEAPAAFGRSPGPGTTGRRLVNLYTDNGGTADRSRAMARRVAGLLGQAGLPRGALGHDESGAPLTAQQLGCRLLFKKVPRPHSELPITYLGQLLDSSELPRGGAPRVA